MIIGRGEKREIIQRIRCASTPPPRDIHRRSSRNRQEPCPGISDLGKPATLLRDPYEYVLDDIGGVFFGAGPPESETVEARRRGVIELIESINATGGEVGEEIAPVLVGMAGGPFTLARDGRQFVGHGFHNT